MPTAVPWQWLLTMEILQVPALTSLLPCGYPTTKLLSTVNRTTAPFLLSLPCRAQLNCQPSLGRTHSLTKYFTSIHPTELHSPCLGSSLYSLGAGPIENTASNSLSIVVMCGCLPSYSSDIVSGGTCLPSTNITFLDVNHLLSLSNKKTGRRIRYRQDDG
jgi:hypothetical protein